LIIKHRLLQAVIAFGLLAIASICVSARAQAIQPAAVAATPAAPVASPAIEPLVIVLPTASVAAVLQYLSGKPYSEVAGLMQGMQRCLQDQVPDGKNTISAKGNCPEITSALVALATIPPSK
jgi:hypothetical protein